MKKMLFLLISISCSTISIAWGPPDYSLNFSADAGTVMLSTTPTSPTLILHREAAQRTIISSSSMTVLTPIALSTGSIITSTATLFQIASSSTPISFSPDGVNSPYGGVMYAVITGTTPFTVSIFRTK